MSLLATAPAGPVIPDFGPVCDPSAFCWSWVGDNTASVLVPALVEHVGLTVVAVLVGLVISLAAALVAYSYDWFEQGFATLATVLYTVPAVAFFVIMVQVTGLNVYTVLIGLVGYTLLLLFRNALTGLRAVPPEVTAAATGMGMTPREILLKINLPLALPSIMAGLRVAVVTVISLATVAAFVVQVGLGAPIVDGLRLNFVTELVAAGVLAVLLALVGDALVVLLERAVTPWARARRN